MAIEGVLIRRKCAGKWYATFWDLVPPDLVALNCQILNCHDFHHSWESPFITKWSLDLQIGPWFSLKAKGFWLKEPSEKIHFVNCPPPQKNKQIKPGNWETLFISENGYFSYAFFWFCFPRASTMPPWTVRCVFEHKSNRAKTGKTENTVKNKKN